MSLEKLALRCFTRRSGRKVGKRVQILKNLQHKRKAFSLFSTVTCVDSFYSSPGPFIGVCIMAEHSQCSKDVLLFDDISIPRYEIDDKKKRPKEAYFPKPGNFFLFSLPSTNRKSLSARKLTDVYK